MDFINKKIIYIFRTKMVLLAIIIYSLIMLSLWLESIDLFLAYFSLFSAVFFCALLIYTIISHNRKLLIFEVQSLILSCESDKNLYDLYRHYNSAISNLKIAKRLLSFGMDKRIIESYICKLSNQKQFYIKSTMLNHYNIVVNTIETKKIHLSKDIYDSCKFLINSINNYNSIFDESNRKLSSSLLEKLDLIMLFTKKYIDAYNVDNKYNIDLMKGQDFEKYCANLLIAYGFKNVEVTKGSGDQGVDIIGYYNGYKYAIQCKRYSKKLGNSPIQEVVAGKNFYKCQGALVITNNYYTESAVQLAKANNVELWDRNNLMQVIYYTDSQWDGLLEKIKIEE